MSCVSKIGSLYELVTKNVVVTTTNTIGVSFLSSILLSLHLSGVGLFVHR